MPETITANQAYIQSGSTSSFADWLAEMKQKGYIQKGEQILADLFTKKTSAAITTNPTTNKMTPTTTILGMPKAIAYTVFAVVAIGAGILIYKAVKK